MRYTGRENSWLRRVSSILERLTDELLVRIGLLSAFMIGVEMEMLRERAEPVV